MRRREDERQGERRGLQRTKQYERRHVHCRRRLHQCAPSSPIGHTHRTQDSCLTSSQAEGAVVGHVQPPDGRAVAGQLQNLLEPKGKDSGEGRTRTMREEPVLTGSEEGGARDVLWQLMAGRREERREGGRRAQAVCIEAGHLCPRAAIALLMLEGRTGTMSCPLVNLNTQTDHEGQDYQMIQLHRGDRDRGDRVDRGD